jgi:ADP-ribose pyrophosphatase
MACEITHSRREYDGAIIGVRVDTAELPSGSQVQREVAEHRDSVAVVAVDRQNRALMIRQYRHPTGKFLWELAAGLCDQAGEQPLKAGRGDRPAGRAGALSSASARPRASAPRPAASTWLAG